MDPNARASIELAIFGTCNVGAPRPDAVIAAGAAELRRRYDAMRDALFDTTRHAHRWVHEESLVEDNA